jgi:signal peptidase I
MSSRRPSPTPARFARWRRIWRDHVKPLAILIGVLLTFRSSVADWHDVPTQSMEPTILVGDRIVVNKLAYDLKVPFTTWHVAEWDDPDRGEVVVFYSPKDGKRMVKRVIGVPGDVVGMRANRLTINGAVVPLEAMDPSVVGPYPLHDPAPHRFGRERLGDGSDAVTHATMYQPARRARRDFAERVVPPGRFLVMGDNRDNSGDSRVFGYVPRDEIVGEAVAVAVSFDALSPRWRRFFRSMD